ncbi:MAG: prefoldin subunit alpha [Candidatus Nanoarchaeia archaeon]|nr:prefoldin subunit alpha [Candidatus Nanoarchaeia archaeon]
MDTEQQQKYAEYQMLNNQLRQLAQEIQNIDHQAKELEMLIEGVEEVGKSAKGTEVLASIGGGLYVKTKLENNNEFLINSGARVISTKTKEEAKTLLEEQLAELKKVIANMQAELQNGIQRIVMLESDLRKKAKK